LLYSFIHPPGPRGPQGRNRGRFPAPDRVAENVKSCPPGPHFLEQLFALFLVNFLGKKSAPDRGRSGGVGPLQVTLPGPHSGGLGELPGAARKALCRAAGLGPLPQRGSIPEVAGIPLVPLRTPSGRTLRGFLETRFGRFRGLAPMEPPGTPNHLGG
jgi:hypothetical protein